MALKLGIVTGLRAEARLFGTRAAAGGGTPGGAASTAEALIAAGATALLSFGLAGGLDRALPSGALLVPRRVLARDGAWTTDHDLLVRLGGATIETLFAAQSVVSSRQAKAAIFAETGAAAVDLESGAVAAVAARHGIPFAVLRAVCDPAARDLPPAALLALDQSGAIGLGRVAGSVLLQPGQFIALLLLARDAARARSSLRRAATALQRSVPDMA